LDAVGVFAYSDEDGTEAASLPAKVGADTIARRYRKIGALVEEVCAQRAEERVGSVVDVLVDRVDGEVEGRAAHQAPEVDGSTTLVAAAGAGTGDAAAGAGTGDGAAGTGIAAAGVDGLDPAALRPGDLVRARVTGSVGVDLVAVPQVVLSPAGTR
jgi:hypothetical protein